MSSTPTENERRVLATAQQLFAERGFDVTIIEIAQSAAVTPAQLRRHFRSKTALLDRVLERLFEGRWRSEWDTLLTDRTIALDERLVRFFTEYRGHTDRISTRLWTRAGLAGLHASPKFSFGHTLAERILFPVIRELRYELELPSPADSPISPMEIELVQMLHGSIAFPNTRSHVFNMPFHGNLAELVAMMVRVWMPGARAEIKRLIATRFHPTSNVENS